MSNKSEFYRAVRDETYCTREEIRDKITDEYIRGLFEGEGCFGNMRDGRGNQVPAFMLKMHVRDKELIEGIRDYLGVPDRVYEYKHGGRHYALLQIRDIGTLKNKIIPIFHTKLLGHKGTQLEAWLKKYPYLRGLHQK